MIYYDVRQELGNLGVMEFPISFHRDGESYMDFQMVAMNELSLNALDIFFANNVTPIPDPRFYKYAETFTPTLVNNVYEIVYDTIALDISFALDERTREIITYGEHLVYEAYSNPTQSETNLDGERHKEKMSKRRHDKNNRIAGEILLSQADKDEAKQDQKLSEYEFKIHDDTDKAITNMYKLETIEEVWDFDIAAEVWNVWTPPV